MNKKRKRISHKRKVETRRLYKFEAIFLRPDLAGFVNRPHSIKFLRELAEKVWAKHGPKHRKIPSIVINETADWSWCIGFSEIELAIAKNTRNHFPHNTIEVLLHELVHALGYGTHGKNFVKKYIQLLVEYGKLNEGELLMGLNMFNIKIHGK